MNDEELLLVFVTIAAFLFMRQSNNSAPATYTWNSFDPAADEFSSSLAFDPSASSGYDPSMLSLSPIGEQFIKQKEGLSLTPYWDVNGFSSGYGHHFQSGEPVPPVLSIEQAEAYFSDDVAVCENAIYTYVTAPLSQGQYDALVDFIFNEGTGAFRNSTLLRRLNTGDYSGAAQELSRWNIAGGVQNASLTARRSGEYQLFTA